MKQESEELRGLVDHLARALQYESFQGRTGLLLAGQPLDFEARFPP